VRHVRVNTGNRLVAPSFSARFPDRFATLSHETLEVHNTVTKLPHPGIRDTKDYVKEIWQAARSDVSEEVKRFPEFRTEPIEARCGEY
jgi:hypothetical protein